MTKGSYIGLTSGHVNVGRWQLMWHWTEWCFGIRRPPGGAFAMVYRSLVALGPIEIRRFWDD